MADPSFPVPEVQKANQLSVKPYIIDEYGETWDSTGTYKIVNMTATGKHSLIPDSAVRAMQQQDEARIMERARLDAIGARDVTFEIECADPLDLDSPATVKCVHEDKPGAMAKMLDALVIGEFPTPVNLATRAAEAEARDQRLHPLKLTLWQRIKGFIPWLLKGWF